MEYKKGLVEIAETGMSGKCDKCHKPVGNLERISRAGKRIGDYGPVCIGRVSEPIISANEKSQFGLIIPGLSFVDYFAQPKVEDVRRFERVEPSRDRRINVLDAFLHLKDSQYLDVPAETELVPGLNLRREKEEHENWRKKGEFIEFYLPSMEEINRTGLTPKQAAKHAVGQNFRAKAGLTHFCRADNRYRIYSLVSMIHGRKISYLCSRPEIREKIEIESDQGPIKVLQVPSASEPGVCYRVVLKNLAIRGEYPPSRAFEFDAASSSPDAAYSNMPRSNANSHYYRTPPVRPDKFVFAALDYLMARPETQNDIAVDPRPVLPSNLACKLEHRLSQRAVHGSELFSGIESEIILWMAAHPAKLGYDKMFG